jgi:ADP-ribosylglycohydrolase
MLGAIAGDVIGSVHEYEGTKSKQFPLFVPLSTFTDDSVLTVAVARWILTGGDLVSLFHEYHAAHRGRGFGGMFHRWALSKSREPYNSMGNGSAMRVSPVGFAFDTLDDVLREAERSAAVTHDHPEGIRGAQATAAAIFHARHVKDRDEIGRLLEARFGYDLSTPLDEIRPAFGFDETCPGTVPQALRSFLESTDYEDAIRNAISLGGDADTLACIAGGVAEAYYGGVPAGIARRVTELLDPDLAATVAEFQTRYALTVA